MANSPDTTTAPVSRRALVAGLAATPVVALPAAADCLAGETIPDPVFALIDAERAARQAHVAAYDALDAPEEAWRSISAAYPDHVLIYGRTPVYSEDQIEKLFIDDAVMTPVERRLRAIQIEHTRRRLRKALADREAAMASCGLTAAEQRADETLKALNAAEAAVFACRPTTLAGAVALLAFVREYVERVQEHEPAVDAVASVEALLAGRA